MNLFEVLNYLVRQYASMSDRFGACYTSERKKHIYSVLRNLTALYRPTPLRKIVWSSTDGALKIKLLWLQSNPQRHNHVGKSWPTTTQCLLIVNGELKNVGTVVKHENDEYCFPTAAKRSATKAMSAIPFKEIRTQIWAEIHRQINDGCLRE